MIKKVDVINFLGESVTIDLFDPEPDHGFIIESIDGLGPAKATINTSESANSDGSIFNSARLNERNIVINLIFNAAPTIEETRQRTYKYFPTKKPVTLQFWLDARNLFITGRVESNEPDIFSKQEGNQISIICEDPFFKSMEKTITVFSGLENLFEFPWENNIGIIDGIEDQNADKILDENLDMIGSLETTELYNIEFSSINEEIQRTIIYGGDADVGFLIKIHAVGGARNIAIYNTVTRERIKIDSSRIASLTGSGITAGDDIIISTVKKNKYARLIRSGVTYNILNALVELNWFLLTKGKNSYAYTAEAGSENLDFSIENETLYEGI